MGFGPCKAARSHSSIESPTSSASGGITSAGAARSASPCLGHGVRRSSKTPIARRSGQRPRRSKPGSVAAAVALYLGSMDFGALADATRRDRRRILLWRRALCRPGAQARRAEVAAKASTPHAAKSFLKALRAVVAVALRGGLRESYVGNPNQDSRNRRLPNVDRRRYCAVRSDLPNRLTGAARLRAFALHGAETRRRNPHGTSAAF